MLWKDLSQVIYENALGNQIARFLKFQYDKNYLRYKVPFLNVVKCPWKLQFDHVIFFGFI